MMEDMAKALEPSGAKRKALRETKLEEENSALRAKLTKKDDIIVEISEEYVKEERELGEL